MNIFLSWSGDTSKKVAEQLNSWLPSVIQALKPFYSPDDISKGKRWSGEIAGKLNESEYGILILTQENTLAPWIMFEAGALSKNISSSRVCTMLFGIKDTDVKGPLSLFQNTKFNKTDVFKLLNDINKDLGSNAIDSKVLSTIFEKMWPDLEKAISTILAEKTSDKDSLTTDRELMEEAVRHLRKLTYNHIVFDKGDFEFSRGAKVIYNKKEGSIVFFDDDLEYYEIGIDQLNTPTHVLDFIFQVNAKGWCKSKHLQEFVNCLEEISEEYFNVNAQGLFCPMGDFKLINWGEKSVHNVKISVADKFTPMK